MNIRNKVLETKTYFIIIIFLTFMGVQSAFSQQEDKFVFTQLKYSGQWDPYPDTWRDILEFINVTTSVKAMTSRRILKVDDPLMFSSPFIMILGNWDPPSFNSDEISKIRRYLTNGGMIFVEDSSGFKGGRFDAGFRKEIIKIFPELRLARLSMEHPVYRSYFLLNKIGGRRLNNNFLEGIDIGGRIALIYSQNDLIGAWAKDRFGNYLWDCIPGGESQRFEAQKMTLNLIMYSCTGTYKSDAIHKPYIEQKLVR